MSKVKICT